MITVADKDNLLSILVNESDDCLWHSSTSNLPERLGLKIGECIALLEYFKQKGLISTYQLSSLLCNDSQVEVTVKAFDLYRRHGFLAEEELFKANIEKLGWEIDHLRKQVTEPQMLETIHKISAIGNSILSMLVLSDS